MAAQRQEGLRQVILCQAPFAGRDAFRYILGVIRDHDLLRFSSVASVINQLFGLMWDSVSQRVLRHTIDMVITYLDDPAARRDAVGTSSDTPPDDQYLALWTEATEDACAAIERARPLLSHDQPERRYVAVHLIALTTLTDHNAGLLTSMLDDPDPRIAARVLMGIGAFGRDDERSRARFDAILRLLSRAPAKTATMPPIVWPWAVHKLDRRAVADALIFACDEDIAGLLPHIPDMSPSVRAMAPPHDRPGAPRLVDVHRPTPKVRCAGRVQAARARIARRCEPRRPSRGLRGDEPADPASRRGRAPRPASRKKAGRPAQALHREAAQAHRR